MLARQLLDRRGEPEGGELRRAGKNQAGSEAQAPTLTMNVDPETTHTALGVGEIDLAPFLQLHSVIVVHERGRGAGAVGRGEAREIGLQQLSVDADGGGAPRFHV